MRFRFNLHAAFAAIFMTSLIACDLSDPTGLSHVLSVKFSEGSPAVDGQTVTYTGGLTDLPSLDKVRLKMTFHVKADNSANDARADFGSASLKPILNFRIQSQSATPVTTTLEPFSVAAKAVGSLDFPVEIPLASIDKAVIRKIINGDPIPYFLSGTLKFDLMDGVTGKGTGVAELDLASGEIETRPSASVKSLVSGLL